MTLLPPRSSRSNKSRDSALDYEILQEQAAALGRLGRALEAALAAVSNYDRAQAEPGHDAASSRWRLIMREYGVPAEVQNRMGVFDGGRSRNNSPK